MVMAGVAGALVASGAVDRTLAHQALAFVLVGGGLWLAFSVGLMALLRGRSYALRRSGGETHC